MEYEIFVVYIISFRSNLFTNKDVHPFCRSYIAYLIVKEVFVKIFVKYANFVDLFSPNLAFKLSEHTKINNHAIKLVNSHYLSYRPIYNFGSAELKILKAYIKINLANRFNRLFKSLANTSILLD